MSDLITNNLATNISNIQALQRVETPAACLTLTRSATLAITTAGTLVTWQTETRNNGFTWSTNTITFPTTGYYAIQCFINTTGTQTLIIQRQINSTNLGGFSIQLTATNYFTGTMIAYYTAGTTMQIRLVPGANTTVSVNAEYAFAESPILHIVQMTGSLT